MIAPGLEPTKSCAVFKAGIVDYEKGLALQEEAGKLVTAGLWDGILILLQHTPVITIGRGGGEENLLVNPVSLASIGVDLAYTNRGGNITCHNPGQVVGYPVFNLNKWQLDVHWYVHTLEETLIKTLSRFELQGERKKNYTGVWLGEEKIAAIGVHVRQWITSHGFALNINNNLDLFQSIVPCGIKDFGVTSLARAAGTVNMENILMMLTEDFRELFNCTMAGLPKLGDFDAK